MSLSAFQRMRRLKAEEERKKKEAELKAVAKPESLSDMTKAELLELAKELGLEIDTKIKKTELIAILEVQDKAETDAEVGESATNEEKPDTNEIEEQIGKATDEKEKEAPDTNEIEEQIGKATDEKEKEADEGGD